MGQRLQCPVTRASAEREEGRSEPNKHELVDFRAVPIPGLVLYVQTHTRQMFASGRLRRAAVEVLDLGVRQPTATRGTWGKLFNLCVPVFP